MLNAKLCLDQQSLLRVAVGIQTLTLYFSEAAQRTIKQAEAEDCDRIDIEHFEKILPQLVCKYTHVFYESILFYYCHGMTV